MQEWEAFCARKPVACRQEDVILKSAEARTHEEPPPSFPLL